MGVFTSLGAYSYAAVAVTTLNVDPGWKKSW